MLAIFPGSSRLCMLYAMQCSRLTPSWQARFVSKTVVLEAWS